MHFLGPLLGYDEAFGQSAPAPVFEHIACTKKVSKLVRKELKYRKYGTRYNMVRNVDQ